MNRVTDRVTSHIKPYRSAGYRMMTDLRPQQSIARRQPSGMGRFFSSANLDRYRQLASGSLGEADQHRLLQALAEEMKAFRRDARMGSDRHSAYTQNIDFQAGDER
jgi:hypothetical protein